jgi:hypothetical protein
VHADLSGLQPQELIYELLGACAVRSLRAPSVAGLRHMLMKVTGRTRDMREVYTLAMGVPASAPATLQRPMSELVSRHQERWCEEVERGVGAAEQATARLKDWLNRQGNYQAATYLTGKNWVRPRDTRPGTLYVVCDARLLPRPWRDAASAALGFDVRLEHNA